MKNKLKLIKNVYFKKNKPVSLILFLTNRCNARCSFCFIDFDDEISQNKKNELTLDDYKKISVNLKDSLVHLNITGGEPFLRDDLDEIVSTFVDNCGLSSIIFSTNGSYPKRIKKFTENICRQYPDVQFIFQFSVDSYPDEHDKIRKIPGLSKKTFESYEIVKKSSKNCLATCNLTVSEQNYDKILEIYNFLTKEKKIETINPILVRNEGVFSVKENVKEKLLLAYKNLTNIITKEVREKKLRGFSNYSLTGDILNAKNEISYEIVQNSYMKPKFYTPCVAGSIFGVMQSNGDVHPCEILDKPFGNIKDYNFDFMKLWNNDKGNETRKWIKDTKCNCHYECIYTYNLVSSPKYSAKLATKVLSNKLKGLVQS